MKELLIAQRNTLVDILEDMNAHLAYTQESLDELRKRMGMQEPIYKRITELDSLLNVYDKQEEEAQAWVEAVMDSLS